MPQPEVNDRLPGRFWRRLDRACTAVVCVALVAAAAVIVHTSFRFIGTAPFLSADEFIPDVAVAFAERGRDGLLAAAEPAAFEVQGTRTLVNYGPLYFYVTAALTWLTGPSLTAFRMIHPVGLIVIGALAAWTFRRVSLAGAAVLVAFVLELYFMAHWPLARPDIVVSLCAAGMFACLRPAIERRSLAGWCGAGFFAGIAATSHQVASALVVTACVVWLWWYALARKAGDRRAGPLLSTLAALMAGGTGAAIIYLVAIDFRLADLLVSREAAASTVPLPFAETVTTHFSYAWSSLSWKWWCLGLLAFASAMAMALATAWLPGERRRHVLALVMPPGVAAVLYPLSLGFYGNNHTGYAILAQVSAVWAMGAAMSVIVAWVAARNSIAGVVATVAALTLLVTSDIKWVTERGFWERRAPGNVRIKDFIDEAMAPLPERASAWGGAYFGLDSGDRLDIIQLSHSLPVIAADFHADRRAELAPDYLVLSSYETDASFIRQLAGLQATDETLAATFPELRYRLVHMVYGPPYGVVRHYEQASSEAQHVQTPGIAVNDGTTPQWSTRLGEPMSVPFTAVEPVTAHVSLDGLNPARRAALVSQTATLPPGFYLIDVRLERPGSGHQGYMLASAGSHFRWYGGWTSYAIPAAPYLAYEDRVMILVDHLGGRLFLSRFENGPPAAYGFHVESVRPVAVAADNPERSVKVDVPAWDGWRAAVNATAAGAARLQLTGTAGAEASILQSPAIAVPPHSTVAATVAMELNAGAVEIGVKAPDGQWLTPPTMMPRRIAFESGRWDRVQIVMRNSRFGGTAPLDAIVTLPEMRVLTPRELYIDQLMKCRSPYLPDDRRDCAQ